METGRHSDLAGGCLSCNLSFDYEGVSVESNTHAIRHPLARRRDVPQRPNSKPADFPDANPPVGPDDIRIVHRPNEILNSPSKCNRKDNRQCPATERTYSLYCALENATREISNKFEHRRAAMQQARFVIEEDLAKGTTITIG